jgi:hypothetical protein
VGNKAEQIDQIEAAKRAGATLSEACARAGTTVRTLNSWRAADPHVEARITAAMRGVLPPEKSATAKAWVEVTAAAETSHVEPATEHVDESHGFPWARYADDPIGRLRALDKVLQANGFHAMSAWWDGQLDAFYATGKFQFTGRIGRRGAKSTTITVRVSVSETIGTPRTLDPGQSGTWPLISHSNHEAGKRLDEIEAVLKAIGMVKVEGKPEEFGKYQRTTDYGRTLIRTLDISGNRVEWVVYPPTINGVSGFTAIGASCDEAAKWRDDKTGANPASVVLASLRPCFATQPAAHLYLFSSAFSTLDAHHDAVSQGDTDMQFLARLGEEGARVDREQRERAALMFEARARAAALSGDAVRAKLNGDRAEAIRASMTSADTSSANVSTWAANPSLSIERTLDLEEDFATWLREYGSVPTGSSGGSFLDHVIVDALMIIVPRVPMGFACGIDPGLSTNSFAAVYLGFDKSEAWIVDMLELVPQPGAPLDDEESFVLCAELGARWGCKAWATDGHYVATARRIGTRHKIGTVLAPNDNGHVFMDFRKAVVRMGFTYGGHALTERLSRQLKGVLSKPMEGGRTKILMPSEAGGAHGDLASAAVRGRWLAMQRNGGLLDGARSAFGTMPPPISP